MPYLFWFPPSGNRYAEAFCAWKAHINLLRQLNMPVTEARREFFISTVTTGLGIEGRRRRPITIRATATRVVYSCAAHAARSDSPSMSVSQSEVSAMLTAAREHQSAKRWFAIACFFLCLPIPLNATEGTAYRFRLTASDYGTIFVIQS
jgi:hypothetical protein